MNAYLTELLQRLNEGLKNQMHLKFLLNHKALRAQSAGALHLVLSVSRGRLGRLVCKEP